MSISPLKIVAEGVNIARGISRETRCCYGADNSD